MPKYRFSSVFWTFCFVFFCLFDFIFYFSLSLARGHKLLCQQNGEMSYCTVAVGKGKAEAERTGLLKSPWLWCDSRYWALGSELFSWTGETSLGAGLGPIPEAIHPKTTRESLAQENIRGFFLLWLSSPSSHRLSNRREQEYSSLLI